MNDLITKNSNQNQMFPCHYWKTLRLLVQIIRKNRSLLWLAGWTELVIDEVCNHRPGIPCIGIPDGGIPPGNIIFMSLPSSPLPLNFLNL